MSKIDRAVSELREMDELAAMRSPVHSLHPLSKLIVTVAFILLTVSFHKYDLGGLLLMVLYPALLFTVSGVAPSTCFYKLRIVLPLVCAVGLFNPLLDHTPFLAVGGVVVSGGVVSMLTLMLKGIFCLTASFLLAATTSMDALCAAMRRIRIPSVIVTLLLLTYRYVSVMVEEVSVMTMAYRLRAPGQKGIHYKAWGSFLGQLLLRSMDRAEELYSAMQLRGFCGEFHYAEVRPAAAKDLLYAILVPALLAVCRYFHPAALFGALVMGGHV